MREDKKHFEGVENEAEDLEITLQKNATFEDFFKALDDFAEDEDIDELRLNGELVDNFPGDIAEEVVMFLETGEGKIGDTKVLDYFKERGYSQSDVEAFLPIKFE